MQDSSTALPSVVPITVCKAARVPRVAAVAITSVTIGPGTMTRMPVISRKAEKRCQFIVLFVDCGLLNNRRLRPQKRHEQNAYKDQTAAREMVPSKRLPEDQPGKEGRKDRLQIDQRAGACGA